MEASIFVQIGDGNGRSLIDEYVEQVAQAYAEGFSRVWSPQLPWTPDLMSLLAVVFRELPDVEVGSAVLPIQVAHPMLTAQRALTLSLISGGRFSLGLGVSHAGLSDETWGVPWGKPVRRLREYLDGLQPLLAGEPADAVGEMVTTRGEIQVPGAPSPDVYLAALGPQMLRLAGQRTAGTITWMTGPKTLANHIRPTLRDAATAASRPDGSTKVIAAVPICVTDDAGAARAQAAKDFAIYGSLPSYRAMLDREGFDGPEDAALIGDENSVADRINELRDAGVDELCGFPFGRDEETITRTRALMVKAGGALQE